MKKILTISIAAYNVENYINNTLDSLLIDNIDDLEILVEDDGGTDNTANIVKEYENKYPGIVKLVHKENGGYGSTVNKSLELAQGKYFKLLDGDDWVISSNFNKFLKLLRKIDVDAIYSPRIKQNESAKKQLNDYFDNEIEGEYNFEDIILKSKDSIIMHTLTYKTELLKSCKLKLLEKCFYTDTQYAMFPTVSAKKIYITHMPVYVYRVGRDEQSISISSHQKHYEDHVRVSKAMIEFYNKNKDILEPNKEKYIFDYTKKHIGNTIVRFYLVLDKNKENLEKIKDFENFVLNNNKKFYDAVEEHSKIVRILRKTNYNYIVYKILAKIKTEKMKRENQYN